MKKSIKLTALALCAVMGIGALAGCGEKQEASGDVTKVTYWHGATAESLTNINLRARSWLTHTEKNVSICVK